MNDFVKEQIILRNREPFDEDFMPETIRFRDSQRKELWSSFFTTPQGARPSHFFLFGPSGSGKSLLVQELLIEAKRRAILAAYVNCWQYQSLHSIIDKIIGDFRLLIAERNNTMYKIEKLERFINKKQFLLVLDDIDRLDPKEIDFILYNLCDLKNVTLVCLGYSMNFLKRLDDRVRSRLVPKIIEFPAYSKGELMAMVKERSERGLSDSCYHNELLKKAVNMANGDARVAIQTIKKAAECAEQKRNDTIHLKDLVNSGINARQIKITKVLESLSEHHRIIYEVIRKSRRIESGKLWLAYKEACHREKKQNAPQRTFQYYRDELLYMGLICSKRLRVRGNVRLYALNPKPI
jgi:archaeal cell division control protein 6